MSKYLGAWSWYGMLSCLENLKQKLWGRCSDWELHCLPILLEVTVYQPGCRNCNRNHGNFDNLGLVRYS